jgi:hypothetical protein
MAEALKYEIVLRRGSEHRLVLDDEVVVADMGAFNLTITDDEGTPFDLTGWEPQVVLKHASVAADGQYGPDQMVVYANPVDLPAGKIDVYVRKKNNIDRMKESVHGKRS